MTKQEAIDRAAKRDRRVQIVIDYMNAYPEKIHFDMNVAIANCEMKWNQNRRTHVYSPKSCGTAACLGGYIILALSPIFRLPDLFGILDNAAKLLFFDRSFNVELFCPHPSPTHPECRYPDHSMSSNRETAIKALLWSAKKQAEIDLERAGGELHG
jgi:hypothetical protein